MQPLKSFHWALKPPISDLLWSSSSFAAIHHLLPFQYSSLFWATHSSHPTYLLNHSCGIFWPLLNYLGYHSSIYFVRSSNFVSCLLPFQSLHILNYYISIILIILLTHVFHFICFFVMSSIPCFKLFGFFLAFRGSISKISYWEIERQDTIINSMRSKKFGIISSEICGWEMYDKECG